MVDKNEFANDKDAALWAVRSGPRMRAAIRSSVHDNRFTDEHTGIVAGNIPLLVERNDFSNSQRGRRCTSWARAAVIRGNRISGGAAMGIVAENARGAIVDNNEIDGLAAYGIMVRGSANTLVRDNRLHNCGYGLAFVLGDANAAEHGRREHDHRAEIQRHRRDRRLADPAQKSGAAAARVGAARRGFPAGAADQKVQSQPFLDNNSFGNGRLSPGAGRSLTGDAQSAASERNRAGTRMKPSDTTQLLPRLVWDDPRVHLLDDIWLLTIFAILIAIGLPWLLSGFELHLGAASWGLLALGAIHVEFTSWPRPAPTQYAVAPSRPAAAAPAGSAG